MPNDKQREGKTCLAVLPDISLISPSGHSRSFGGDIHANTEFSYTCSLFSSMRRDFFFIDFFNVLPASNLTPLLDIATSHITFSHFD